MLGINDLQITYVFLNEGHAIANRDSRDVPKILSVDARVVIEINGEIYFDAELPVLEFYKALYEWKRKIKKSEINEFHYYSIENDAEEGAILSLIPFANQARVKTIWPKIDVYSVFESNEAVHVFCKQEETLKEEIEAHFDIQIKRFLKHIPLYLSDCT